MKKSLPYDLVKSIYNRTADYYDKYHNIGTMGIDERGRKFLVNKIVKPGYYILDAGGGTGNTALKALQKTGRNGKAVILDFSSDMLKKASQKAEKKGLRDQLEIVEGDMYDIPFPDNTFDAVFSTYSTCPLADPVLAVKEMLRVTKVNGMVGIAHSTDSPDKIARQISAFIEYFIWKFPRLSLGCRNIQIMDDIKQLPVEIIDDRIIGFIPFYFRLIVLRKL